MRVLVAPDGFGGTLSAVEAAAAMAAGWSAARPGDVVEQAPQSDGGPGFVEALAALGTLRERSVCGPLGGVVLAPWLSAADGAAYIEVASACGLHLVTGGPTPRTAFAATSRGVGELISGALAAGADRLVLGLGGSACTDGGRGMVEALGGVRRWRDALAGVEVIAATDVRNALLGPSGAAAVFGPQKGADAATVVLLEERLARWATTLARASGVDVARREGAGAAGGIGAALLAAGARVRSGADLVGELTGRRARVAGADLVLTGEGCLDAQTLQGKLVARLAAEAEQVGTPVAVLAGQVALAPAQWRAMGAARVFSLTEFAGSARAATDSAAEVLEGLAKAAAADWPV